MAGPTGLSGRGGAGRGQGAKKNQHRITVNELRSAIEAKLGMPFQQMLAETQLILFNNFKNGENVKEYITFTENNAKRLLEQPIQEVSVTNPLEELSPEDIQNRINNLLTRAALTQPTESDTDSGNEESETV